MASFTLFSSSSSVGFFGTKITSSFKPLPSFSSISLRKDVDIQRRCCLMAKEQYPKIYHDDDDDMSTVKKMQVGVNKLIDVVGGLLGPKRHDSVLMSKINGYPKTVSDGLRAAKEVELDDRIERLGVGTMRRMASNMNDVVGDGTTTFMVLTQGLITEGVKAVLSGGIPNEVTDGIERILNGLCTELKRMSKEVEDDSELADVAAVSAGNDYEIGNMIGEAMSKVGRNGVVVTLKGRRKHAKNSLYVVEGMQFDRGYFSPYYVTDSKEMSFGYSSPYFVSKEEMWFDQENCKVLLVDKITNATDLVRVFEDDIKGGYPILIISEDVQQQVLDTLEVNKLFGASKIAVLKAPVPTFAHKSLYLDDIAILTGGTVIREEVGLALENVGSEVLGFAAKVVLAEYTATIVGDGSTHDSLNRWVDKIRELVEPAKYYEKERLNQRLAKLSGRVAVIEVGAETEKEVEEKKLRFEVALKATKAAVKEGIVVGGGCALLRLAATVDSIKDTLENDKQKVAADVVKRALSYPIKQIAKNAGVDGNVVIEKVLSSDNPKYGYNVVSETYEDLMAAGIVDPTMMVERCLVEAWYVVWFFTSNPIIIDRGDAEPIPDCHKLLL